MSQMEWSSHEWRSLGFSRSFRATYGARLVYSVAIQRLDQKGGCNEGNSVIGVNLLWYFVRSLRARYGICERTPKCRGEIGRVLDTGSIAA